MFKVMATVVGFVGNERKYPCHFGHEVGDEFLFDGEKFLGRICPHVLPALMPHLAALCEAGPRYVQPSYYAPYWYAPPNSVRDPSMTARDGAGWRSVQEVEPEPPFSMGALLPPGAFSYPGSGERTVNKEVVVLCPDVRTSVAFRLEAFDLSELGVAPPYFRKAMAILDVVRANEGTPVSEVRDKLSVAQREEIYPLAAPALVLTLIDQLEALGFVDVQGGRVFISEKGKAKLDDFVKRLSADEQAALEINPA
jgi:uncharacterized repeat protein (TIGR04076 family)